jgi:hypothetical protein
VKILQVVPRRENDVSLKRLLNEKERELRGRGTTFVRKKAGRWVHKNFYGWISWGEISGGILVAEIHSKAAEAEWQLLKAFIGYLDRHFAEEIESITITYR